MKQEEMLYYPPKPPVKIMDPEWLVRFMSEFDLNENNKKLLIKAIIAYYEKCYNASLELETDLNNIPGVDIKK
jgi:hypothetical protein